MRKFSLLITALLYAATASAAVPTKESVDTLLTITHVETTIDGMLDRVDAVMAQAMKSASADHPATPEQQRAFETMRTKVGEIFREEMDWAKLEPQYVQIYQETFTQDEIDGLISFYRTPVGVAYVDKLPIVLQKSFAMTQARMGPMMKRLQEAMKQSLEEAKGAQ